MAIYKRAGKNGSTYQVKIKGSDGRWITESCDRLADAEKKEAELKLRKMSGAILTNLKNQVSVSEYFLSWHEETRNGGISKGWREAQVQMFRDYVEPLLGKYKLQVVSPALASRVLSSAADKGLSASVQLHLYNLMHKMFGDAVELFEVLQRNPIIKKLRPKVPQKESRYLDLDEIEKLLRYVEGKNYQVAIWLQLFAGMRVGEVQYLKWENVDLENGIILVKGTYLRREDRFQDHPKGKKWHRLKMPLELWGLLKKERLRMKSPFVATIPTQDWLPYHGYRLALKRYCRLAGVKLISTHGLRHSTSELYMAHGASRDDLRMLFAHSSSSVTDRYVHDKGTRLEKVADNVLLFRPKEAETSQGVSQKFPKRG